MYTNAYTPVRTAPQNILARWFQEVKGKYLLSSAWLPFPKLIQIITPPLGHLDALIPVVSAIVDTANSVAVSVRERPFDGIGVPEPALVEHGRCGRAQPVRRHFVLGEAHTPKRRVDGILAHWALAGMECREDVALAAGNRF